MQPIAYFADDGRTWRCDGCGSYGSIGGARYGHRLAARHVAMHNEECTPAGPNEEVPMPKTRWNGEPCQARRITAVVADTSDFPQYWARHLVGTRRNIVEVVYNGETSYLDDEDDSGWHKVTNGGSPRWAHSNIVIDLDTIQPRSGHADPDTPCPHEDFDAYVAVNRITASDSDPTVTGYAADIKVNCRACDEPFRWTGVPAGVSPAHPTCSVDETELCAPLRPASADPDFGLGLPGFAVRYRGQG
ncbi:hypothetical protein [Streptomyces sp. CRN 30]|uniref:hypothetical protein n=1 Tax=Streptomyces sp. CRN 30 TaxID=3075613 RepID=UPI002A841C92|nr:hypothetical protein [Streptomyces sp. CRN 30]